MNGRAHYICKIIALLGILIVGYPLIQKMRQHFLEDSVQTAIDVNARDRFGNTILMNAVIAGNAKVVKELLQDPNTDLNAIANNTDKDPILTIACVNAANVIEQQSLDVIRLLVEAGADVNKPSSVGLRALHGCCRVAPLDLRLKIMHLLVDNGAHVNAQAADGATVMHVLVSMNLPDGIRVFLKDFGQLINFNKQQVMHLDLRVPGAMDRYTPLELARRLGHVGVDSCEEAILNRPKPLGWDGNIALRDAQGRNPLMLAMMRGDAKLVSSLMGIMKKKKVSLAQVDAQGRTTLMYAVIGDSPRIDVATVLQDPDVAATINAKDKLGLTALLLVTFIELPSDRLEVANMLARSGADLKVKDMRGRHLGERARRLGDAELVKWYAHKVG